MPTDTVSIAEFVATNRISIKSERTYQNPNRPNANNMDHWKCVLNMSNKKMTVYFSMGYGHKGAEPKAEEVLRCLASDSASITENFEEWAADLGYDSDSRKALKTYKACEHSAKRLENFLGYDLYQQLLYETESL